MKKEIFRKNSENYNKLCNMFCTRFVETFGEITGMNYQQVESLFKKRINKICVGSNNNNYDILTKKINLVKLTEHIFIHEALHAISAVHMRRKVLKNLLLKKTSDFNVDEGITEYYTCCILKTKDLLLYELTSYTKAAITMELIEMFSDKREMINFYLNNSPDFINRINDFIPMGYSKLKMFLNMHDNINSNVGFFEDNLKELAPIRQLLTEKLLNPLTSTYMFKKNVDILLGIYKQDIYSIAYRLYIHDRTLKKLQKTSKSEAEINAQKQVLINIMTDSKEKLEKLKKILKVQWESLNINDDNLFNEIVMEVIKQKFPNIYNIIFFINIFPFQSKKNETTENRINNSLLTNNYNIMTEEYNRDESVTVGRKRRL